MGRRDLSTRTASLFLGKDHERWAPHDPERMVGPVWKGVKSAQSAGMSQWNDAPTRLPMRASSLGIIAEYAHEALPVNGSAMDGAVPLDWKMETERSLFPPRKRSPGILWMQSGMPRSPRSPEARFDVKTPVPEEDVADVLAESSLQSPKSLAPPKITQPARPSTLNVASGASTAPVSPVETTFAAPTPLFASKPPPPAWEQLPSVETRRNRRSRLLRIAEKERERSRPGTPEHGVRIEPRIPLYGDLEMWKLCPRRTVEHVEGTLYDSEGPFMEGATSDSLSVRLFYAPGVDGADGVSYLITTPDNRVFSAAKRRRWAMDNHGNFFAAMEIKSVESKLAAVHSDIHDQIYAEEYERDLRKHFLGDVLDELQKAESLMTGPRRQTPHLLQTEDGKLVRLEEDFPEEAFFAIAGSTEQELYPVIAKVFVEAIQLLWELHSHGWMHGDIKLENLMFDSSAKLVLIDFENASPFRGSRQHDGKIQLLSFDWTPPELEVSHLGRRMGPSGDLWALGCNLIRAFALRDGVEDTTVREMLLGPGLPSFFAFRKTLLDGPERDFGVDLGPLLEAADTEQPAPLIHPARLLRRFAHTAPRLLQYVLAHAVTPTPAERNERRGVELAQEMLHDPLNVPLWQSVKTALATSIGMSGSAWVRPKLDEARAIMELT